MSKHVSISKKIAAGMMAGLMLGSFVPVQAGWWGSIRRLGDNIKTKVSAIGSGVDRLWDNIVDTSDNMNVIRENIVTGGGNIVTGGENIVNNIGNEICSFFDRARNFYQNSNVPCLLKKVVARGNNIVNDISNRTRSFCRTNKKRILFTGFVAGTLLTMAGLTMLIRGDYSDLQAFSLSNLGRVGGEAIDNVINSNGAGLVTVVGGLALSGAVLSAGRNSHVVNDMNVVVNNEIDSSGSGEPTTLLSTMMSDSEYEDDDDYDNCA